MTSSSRQGVPGAFSTPNSTRNKLKKSLNGRKSCLLSIYFADFHLPLLAVRIQCLENHRSSLQIDGFLHTRNGRGMEHGYSVELYVANTELEHAVFLRSKTVGYVQSSRAGSMTSRSSILAISFFSNLPDFGTARFGAE